MKKIITVLSSILIILIAFYSWSNYYGIKVVSECYPLNYFVKDQDSAFKRVTIPSCGTGGLSVGKASMRFINSNSIVYYHEYYNCDSWYQFPMNYYLGISDEIIIDTLTIENSLYSFSGDTLIISPTIVLY